MSILPDLQPQPEGILHGPILKQARQRLGFSRADVEQDAGVNRQTLNWIERSFEVDLNAEVSRRLIAFLESNGADFTDKLRAYTDDFRQLNPR